MTNNLQYFLNRELDVAAVGSFLTKTFTIYVVACHTPKKMRHFANLLLVGILWNFIGNLLFTVAHPIPLFPAQCFRLDGALSAYVDSEAAGHFCVKFAVFTILNMGLAIFFSFQFRYMELVHSHRFSHIHPAWGYVYCLVAYVSFSACYMFIYDKWTIPLAEYPDLNQIEHEERLFCYKPRGGTKQLAIGSIFGFVFVQVLLGAFFSIRSFRHLNRKHPGMHDNTILLQKRLLRSLLYLTSIPIVVGGLPAGILFACLYFNEMNEARLMFSICMVILLNHGSVYSATTLLVFKKYRNAARKIVVDVVRKLTELRKRIGRKCDAQVASNVEIAKFGSVHAFCACGSNSV